ncbi:2OG-Fe(II) oxygenase [Trichormus variabilis ATCC 29413]|uniref:2OG-Fe(II) oxygenase n=2 Tax=Anabaena variabilis TaxID=264691 RepID=Q3M330_TRIV2|nr:MULTISPECIES: 2-oxoglutarate and iron-dependent oxygenase domain-containing protein [Nostocaceae]ABA24606.1 2OG-Fe(II) oxygenase [Trichormus variabilis ATCC 29413]MBC1213452.1 isopenicillin N synthase family oxygenase [Trichormus variabilis ARAD]MBC1255706.1 isopenicillin N synthase family oxygenase [Trichormus variabilis V5]MBC1266473.1 isopenicillin N synthase family oxygenase [Trichormus variabilis FSR]MBC1301943.1 isopenicillin N synthase family oxygenase [Trichormus variabilis N2B]
MTVLQLPIIDISGLTCQRNNSSDVVAQQIKQACQDYGFFYIVGHGVDEQLQTQLEHLSQEFFAQDQETKLKISMALGGRAWRGYFPVGNELTSGRPDLKEGIYFGSELKDNHPLVKAGTPMHGRNLFPSNIPQFRETVLEYIDSMTKLGHILMAGIALSLDLDKSYFAERYTKDPLILFRIFNYPPNLGSQSEWGVGEHTDYGVLTILKQDNIGGLQVKSKSGWIDAPPIPGSFVCNIGDMLDRMTRGLYRSTPHRVRNLSTSNRLSFPFFFDPNFNVEVKPIDLKDVVVKDDQSDRWDKASVHEFRGTYGDYLLKKVSKVFPELRQKVL